MIGNIHWGPSVYVIANMHFTVPTGRKLVYIGTVQMVAKADWATGHVEFRVLDDYETELKEFREKFPEVQDQDAATNLLRFR